MERACLRNEAVLAQSGAEQIRDGFAIVLPRLPGRAFDPAANSYIYGPPEPANKLRYAQALAEVQLGEGHHAQWPGAGERLSLTCAAVVTEDVNKVFHYRKSIIWANRIVPEFMGDSEKLTREIWRNSVLQFESTPPYFASNAVARIAFSDSFMCLTGQSWP